MADTILDTFYTLKETGTFIRLQIPDRDYERIVIVSDIRTATEIPLIAIDCPAGMADILADGAQQPRLNFEFTGPDGLRYHFTADDAFIHGNTLLITVPKQLERVQRRNDFRLTAPLGAHFYFTAGDQRKRVKMLDASISGTSGILICLKNGIRQSPPVEFGQTILNLKLAFTVNEKEKVIPVRECEVRRMDRLPQKGRYRMAVTFTRMDADCRAQLREYLLSQQRRMLQIRQQR